MTTQRPLPREIFTSLSHRACAHYALRALLLLALCAFPFAFAQAQSATATLSGTVEDEDGAVIPGAAITVLNPSTALQRQATTNDQGSFTVTLLQPGTYSVTVRRDGFAPIEVKNVTLNVGDQRALKIQLKAGDVKAEVQVTTDAPLINESPAVATTVDRRFVGNLPLNGRSFQSLILLTPGVVVSTVGFSVETSNTPGQFSVNGQRSNANYFTVDGVSANTGVSFGIYGPNVGQYAAGSLPGLSASGSTASLVSIDALEEFKIQTSTYSAEFGRQPGGQVQLVTRSGQNQFHGSAFESLRNEAFEANNWFNNANRIKRPVLRQNQFGGTLSGPVMLPRFGEGGKTYWNGRNKTFFFFSYEGLRLRIPVTFNRLVPSLRLRQLAPPAMQTLLNTIPRPTGPETTTSTGAPTGVARFVGSGTSPSTLDATSIRIDHALNSKLALFGRYNEVPSSSLSRNLSYLTGLSSTSRTLTVGATLSLNRRLTNELRVNYSSNRGRQNGAMDDFGGAVPIDQSVLLSGYTGPGAKYGEFLFNLPGAGVAVNLGDSVDSYQRQMNVVDSFSLVRGTHQFKFGFDYRRLSPVFGPRAFGQRVSVFSEAMILSGLVFLRRFSSQGSRPVFENFSAYLEDTWKLSRRLTLNLGLRWELNPPPHDANGRKPLLVQGVDNVPTATLAPADAPYYRTSYTAFAPRFGIAYQLRQRQGRETILRGGFGVYYDLNAGEAAAGFTGFPFSNAIAGASAVPFPIPPELVGPPPLPTVTPPITVTLYALKPDLRLPYALQWNVTLEQSLGATQTLSLAYVASLGRRLLTTQTLNWPLNGFGSPRSNPNFSDIQFTTNGPSSSYHSLQTQYRRRFSRGLQAMVNYTWSHAIDQVSNEVTGTTLERGNADFDVRHNLTAGVTYDIPKPSAGPVLSALFRGWSVDSTLYVQSGQPVNLSAGQLVRPDGTFFDVRPDVITGVPIWIKDPTKPGGRRINSAAFSLPPLLVSPFFRARQGTLGRNVVRSPGKYQVNMSLRRQFKLSEKSSLQLRAEVFNLLNHPLFGQYDTDVTSSRFGQALSTLNVSLGGLNQLYQLGGPRSLQFSARFSF